MEEGYEVHLVNTAAVQTYTGLKYTNDAHDARWLAHLLRLGILPTGYIYPKGGTRGSRFVAQADANGAYENDKPIKHPESLYP
jgi:hypothetical protein